ncbi:MAG: hypothetical protein JXB32_10610 [Deltaproteobacteria bacterium]|nr:hypothetical protein [Deltaproteobacteria bacterium]
MSGGRILGVLSVMLVALGLGCGPAAAGEGAREPIPEPSASGDVGAGPLSGTADEGDLDTPLPCPVAGGPEGFGPIPWPAETAGERWALHQTNVAKVRSSQARPVEVCGVRGQVDWLMRLTCPDGSRAFSDPETAHNSRAGNVGSGGRCDTIIDLYLVPCPDREYEVYMDLYHCAPGESF